MTMMFFVSFAKAATYIGKQDKALELSSAADILIEDCYFENIGGYYSATSPVHLKGGSGSMKVQILTTFFQNTRARFGGTFHLETAAKIEIRKTGSFMTQSAEFGWTAACGQLNAQGGNTAVLSMNSFVKGIGGTYNLELDGNAQLDHINSSQCKADNGYHSGGYGNIYFGSKAGSVAKIEYSTLHKDESTKSNLYFWKTAAPRVYRCNFLENTNGGYGMVMVDYCKGPLNLQETVFQKNNHKGHEIVFGWGSPVNINNCVLDSSKFGGTVPQKNYKIISTQPIRMELYATRNIAAAVTPVPQRTAAPDAPKDDNDLTNHTGSDNDGDFSTGDDSTDDDPEGKNKNAAALSKESQKKGSNPVNQKVLIAVIVVLAIAVIIVAAIFTKLYHQKHMDEEYSYSENQAAENEQPEETQENA